MEVSNHDIRPSVHPDRMGSNTGGHTGITGAAGSDTGAPARHNIYNRYERITHTRYLWGRPIWYNPQKRHRKPQTTLALQFDFGIYGVVYKCIIQQTYRSIYQCYLVRRYSLCLPGAHNIHKVGPSPVGRMDEVPSAMIYWNILTDMYCRQQYTYCNCSRITYTVHTG